MRAKVKVGVRGRGRGRVEAEAEKEVEVQVRTRVAVSGGSAPRRTDGRTFAGSARRGSGPCWSQAGGMTRPAAAPVRGSAHAQCACGSCGRPGMVHTTQCPRSAYTAAPAGCPTCWGAGRALGASAARSASSARGTCAAAMCRHSGTSLSTAGYRRRERACWLGMRARLGCG